MKVIQRAEYIWSDELQAYQLVREESYDYVGEVGLCKGASTQQTDLANSQTAFYNQMTKDYKTQFGNQNAILTALTTSLSPILAKGPNQFGFSDAQTQNLNSKAIQGSGQQYQNASKALREVQATQGGGNMVLPSGVNTQQQSELASGAAVQASNELLGIQQAGYQQGHSDYQNAIAQLGGVAGMYNPNAISGDATKAGNAAGNELNVINQENQQAMNNWTALGGAALGGAGQALSCPAAGSLYLMADGSEKLVENLQVGDKIAGIDGDPQEIEEIQIGPLPVVRVITENGHTTRNSTIHAFALPKGGFVIASRSLGKTVVTADGPSKVISVKADGVDTIYNVITDGSHTYRADGVWALGQGEGEREVSTEAWTKIAHRTTVPEVEYAH